MTLTAQAHPPQPAGHAPGTHSSSHAQAVIVGHHLGAAAAAHSSHVLARHHHAAVLQCALPAAGCMGLGFRLKCRVIKASRVQQQQPTESSGNVILSHVVRQQQQHLHVASLSHTNTQTHAKRCKRHCKKKNTLKTRKENTTPFGQPVVSVQHALRHLQAHPLQEERQLGTAAPASPAGWPILLQCAPRLNPIHLQI